MGEVRLGPIEWGVVTAHHPWGMGVRLEESGDDGVIVLDSIHDDFLRCNGEYWPEIGERIRVRRYIYGSPDDEVRLTSCESAMEGLVNGYDPPRQYPLPEGFGPVEEGTVVARRDWGVEVRLDSGQIGQLRARLMESGPDPAPEDIPDRPNPSPALGRSQISRGSGGWPPIRRRPPQTAACRPARRALSAGHDPASAPSHRRFRLSGDAAHRAPPA